MILKKIVRQGDASQQKFRDVLNRLRFGDSTVEDWRFLNTRNPSKVTNSADWDDAPHLMYGNSKCDAYNVTKMKDLGTNIAVVQGQHPNTSSKNAAPRELGNLKSRMLLAKNTQIML